MNNYIKSKTVGYPKDDLDFVKSFVKKKAKENGGILKETDIFRAMLKKWIEEEKKK